MPTHKLTKAERTKKQSQHATNDWLPRTFLSGNQPVAVLAHGNQPPYLTLQASTTTTCPPVCVYGVYPARACVLTPAEGHSSRAVGALLDERLVELAPRTRVDRRPAVLAVVLQHNGDMLCLVLYMHLYI